MFFIIQVDGCLPYISIMIDEEGEPLSFNKRKEAEKYGNKNCAWDFQIIEFN